MNTDISSQLETIRDWLNRADHKINPQQQVGDILIALSYVTDLLEQTNKRIDDIHERRRIDTLLRERGVI